jgi:fructose-1,6-bisphosphatase I
MENGFYFKSSWNVFYLSHPDMQFSKDGIFTLLMKETMFTFHKNYLGYCQSEEGDRPYTSRYIGSLVLFIEI